MAKRNTDGLSLNELTFYEVKQKHLREHAKSLGGKKAIEAVKYLIEIDKRIKPTQEELQARREELQAKTKRKKVEVKDTNGNTAIEYRETNTRLYSDKMIEKLISEYKGEQVNNSFAQKRMYCEKFWIDKLPDTEGKEKVKSHDEELAALLAELEQA